MRGGVAQISSKKLCVTDPVRSTYILLSYIVHALLAQLVRASASHAEGQGFESLRAHREVSCVGPEYAGKQSFLPALASQKQMATFVFDSDSLGSSTCASGL